MRRIIISLFLLSTLFAGTAHSRIYTWVDEDGRTQMSDKPPKTGGFNEIDVKVNVISSQKPPAKDTATTTASQQKPVASGKKVIMYSAEWCGVCTRARRYFNANNIPFTEYDIDKSTKGRREYKKLGGRGVPLILVDKHRLNGFSTHSFQRAYQKPQSQ